MIIHLTAVLIKKILYKMSQYFPKPNEPFERDIHVKVVLSNYATNTDLKKAAGIGTFNLVLKSNLAKLKAEIHKINVDVDKLKTVAVDLRKLSNVVSIEVIKQTVHDRLVAKVNNNDINGFILKTKYDTDKFVLKIKMKLLRKLYDKLVAEVNNIDINGFVLKTKYDAHKFVLKIKTKLLRKLYNKLVAKVSGFVLKTKYDTDKSDLEKKISDADKNTPDTSRIVEKQIIMLKLLK